MDYVKNSTENFEIIGRNEWPFKDMAIGDCIIVKGDVGIKAQIYCHVYGRQSNKKFKTKSVKGMGLAIIREA